MNEKQNKENEIENKKKIDIKKKMKRITGIYLAIFLAIILLISLYINMASFRKQFISNELSFYAISGGRVVDKIENGLLYGKSLDKFYGMDQLLEDWREKNKETVNLKLLSADKKTTYYQLFDESSYRDKVVDDSTFLEIRDSDGLLCGYLNLSIDLGDRMEVLFENQISFFCGTAILLFIGILGIIIFCGRSDFITKDYKIERKKILVFMLLVLLLLQAAFTVYSSVALRGFYLEIFRDTGKEIETLVQDDIHKVIEQGVTYDQIYNFDSYAEDVTDKAPMIDSIKLDGDKLIVSPAQSYLENVIRKMLVDMLTVLVTSMFIAAEIVNYMMISINRRVEKISGTASYDKQLSIRVSSFLIHVACYLPISFIPIMMYEFTGGKASDFFLGLPVMILFATGFVFTLLAGNWSLRYGWKKLLLIGTGLVIFSSLLAGLIENAVALVIARGIYGAAYALIYVAIREFATVGVTRQERSKSLAQVTAGLYAGINIGAVLGAIIYESIGFSGVFVISAIIGTLAVIVVKHYCLLPETSEEEEKEAKQDFKLTGMQSGVGFLPVMKDRGMIRLALFIIAPLAITSLFFEYFLPVYTVKAEISSADIGRAFLINGIAIAYGAPLIVKLISGRIKEKVSLFLFTLLMAVGFIAFGLIGGVAGILIASGIMGIAEGTALVSQNVVMLDLEIARRAGTSRMLSIYATIRKLPQMAGAQIFAAFMLLGYQSGMIVFGVAIVVCSVIFIWSMRGIKGELNESNR